MDLNLIPEHIERLERGETITEFEKNVFDLVLKTCAQFSTKVIVRVAGGWVRDRIIGKQSSDIDLAVEGMGCRDFASALQKESGTASKMTVIAANAEMSKRMETVRFCLVRDFWLDICDLRPFDMNSSEQGTPIEDAQRRDFTINALFYNINTSKVEDFVDGIRDFQQMLIKTPIDPIATFSEDPLRVIRGVRFAAKYGFKLDPEIFKVIPTIKPMFETRVTKERISAEILKALESSSPTLVLNLLIKTTLFTSVFDPKHMLQIDENAAYQRVATSLSRCDSKDKVLPLILSAIYFDISNMGPVSDPMKPKKKMDPIEFVISRELKISLKISKEVSSLLKSATTVKTLPNNMNRLAVGHWIREIGIDWNYTRCLLYDNEILNFFDNELTEFINTESLLNVISLKPLFNGKELANIHNVKAGPGLGALVEQLVDWQIMNPNSSPEDYIGYIHSL